MVAAIDASRSNDGQKTALSQPEADAEHLPFAADTTKTNQQNLETYLLGLLAQVLKLPPQEVSLDKDLYDYGVDSIIGMQVRRRLEETFAVQISSREMLEHRTIRALAVLLNAKLDGLPHLPPTIQSYPLSAGQKGLWLLQKLTPEMSAYNVPVALRVRQPLQAALWQKAFEHLLVCYPILQTTFREEASQPIQMSNSAQPLHFEVEDVAHLGESDLIARLQTKVQEPFDLAAGPLMRVHCLPCSETEYILLLTIHHIIIDGTSMIRLIESLLQIYQALARGQEPHLAEIIDVTEGTYHDFVQWEEEMLAGEAGQKNSSYWQAQLAGELPHLALPIGKARTPQTSYCGDIYKSSLEATLAQRIEALARTHRISLATFFLAIFKVLLHRYTGQDEILIGMPTAGRPQRRFEQTVGYFVNLMTIRSQIDAHDSFLAYVEQLQWTLVDAQDHSAYPFSKVVEDLSINANASTSPLFQAGYAFQNFIQDATLATFAEQYQDHLPFELLDEIYQRGEGDLGLDVSKGEDGYLLRLKYNPDRFHKETIARMMGHFQTLLTSVVERPDQSIAALPLLTTAERHQLLTEWNDTATDFSEDKCIHHLFEEQVARTPDAMAILFEDQRLTYGELNSRANQLAHYLQTLGVGPEVVVGICIERSIESVVAILGILKAGGAYLSLDPGFPIERLTEMLVNAKAKVLITDNQRREKLSAAGCRLCGFDVEAKTLAQISTQNPRSQVRPEHLAAVIYTSGSTGNPKGILLEHRGLCNTIEFGIRFFEAEPTSRLAHFVPFSFDAATFMVFMPLCSGARLCIASMETVMDPASISAFLREHEITITGLPPSILAVLPATELPALRLIGGGGEACPPDLVTRWGQGRRFVNAYGPAETTIMATITDCKADGTKPSIGRPVANTQIYILDPYLNPVPIGVAGELYIGALAWPGAMSTISS